MSRQDLTEQLHEAVDSILRKHDADVFEGYWELAKRALTGHPVRQFYIRVEEDYGNVAVLTDDAVADIEGDDKNERGHFGFHRISALSDVELYKERVPTIPDSDGAELVIVVNTMSSTAFGLYWVAKTEQESEYLLEFGRALVALLGGSSG